MLDNINKIIHNAGNLRLIEARYGNYIFACIDIDTQIIDDVDNTITYSGTDIYDAIDIATSPGDTMALEALFRLERFSNKHSEFLYSKNETLEETLKQLEERAKLWNRLSDNEQKALLLNFVKFEQE